MRRRAVWVDATGSASGLPVALDHRTAVKSLPTSHTQTIIVPKGDHTMSLRLSAVCGSLVLFAVLAPAVTAPLPALDVEADLKAAKKAIERRDFAKARELLAKCLKAQPDNADLLFLAARTARRDGAYEEAERHLKECQRQKGPREAIALEQKLLRAQYDDLDSVEKDLLEAVKKDDPDKVLILESLSLAYIDWNRWKDALACLNQWRKQRPKDVQPLIWRAYVRTMTADEDGQACGDSTPGQRDYERAIEIDPECAEARLRLATELLERSEIKKANEQFEYLQERHPKNAEVLVGLARCKHKSGEPDEAVKLLEAVLKGDPKHARALLERGLIALEAGEEADAEKWLRRSVAVDPSGLQANSALWRCLLSQGKESEAKAQQAKLKRIEEDMKRFVELVDSTPRSAASRSELGLLLLRNNLQETGLRWLHRALKVDPKHKPTHLALAEYYQKVGKKDLAEKHRRLAEQPDQKKKEPK
jgi:Tfp pilus assembly protein PilF